MYTRHRSVTVGSVFTDPVVSITDLLDLSAMSLNLCTVVIVDSCCIGTCDGIIGLKMSFYQTAAIASVSAEFSSMSFCASAIA